MTLLLIKFKEVFSLSFEIYGPYKSMDEAVAEVEVLGLKGYKDESIHMIAKEDLATDLNKKVNTTVISTYKSKDDKAEEHLYDIFRGLNMSKVQSERFKDSIKSGQIIVAVNPEEYRMGNEIVSDTETLKEIL